ncbi:SDR family NAD(P)-dependent oxidoreductase [Mucilaginibacter sp. L3T2-6]|uniref:SDR family NAD(P)-dependent oxidoreductase n=1 Tax=Mucilaginibacter sp. L3T2-6 TaxID=3062491 RepID=UPI002676B71C|nr:SDR family NAD(P)-dependent oxidoreductase [Mucilaginibacter sp. L3T2-6]MDO3642917.1 SDR family NAD(P)-dependent oxidoreductase [Mucilaginibacter sp. L3T2-6]MDV6215242.1 SDR family NAD(P)-dependent oxidoreductase [Mucilaginibacter sp. L3T2-6]
MENQQIALVTGVSRKMGLGYETAKQLAEAGYRVIISARDVDQLSDLSNQLRKEGHNTSALTIDILSDESVNYAAKEVAEKWHRLDVLINNAGGFYDQGGLPMEQSFDFVHKAFETNLFGAWRMIKAFVPLLEKSDNGRIVNVSSGAGAFSDIAFGLIAKGDTTAYGLSKLALNGLTVKLAAELKSKGIKVNAVCPGFTATYPGTAEWGARPVEEGAKSVVWAATLPKEGPTGGFYRDGKKLPW